MIDYNFQYHGYVSPGKQYGCPFYNGPKNSYWNVEDKIRPYITT